MRSSLVLMFRVVILLLAGKLLVAAEPSGDAQIEGATGESKIVIRTTNRLAGAIDSLTWNGKEFIDSTDHGRQLQSACSFHNGEGRFVPETFNPTEAGSRFDGAGPKSSSKLLSISASRNRLTTKTRMAYWLQPGERSDGMLARNTKKRSECILTKQVTIGVMGLPHAIEYIATFTVPQGGRERLAQFEAVTGYMPAEFEKFYTFDVTKQELKPLSDGPGEQHLPVILATEDGAYAMGVWSPDQPSNGFEHAGYGRFRFNAQKVVKWNCVFRIRDADGVAAGDYTFRSMVAVGTLGDVQRTLTQLAEQVEN